MIYTIDLRDFNSNGLVNFDIQYYEMSDHSEHVVAGMIAEILQKKLETDESSMLSDNESEEQIGGSDDE